MTPRITVRRILAAVAEAAEAVARKAAAHPLIAAIDAATHDCIARVAS